MRWPWSRSVERRASYTDALVGAVFAQAAGTSTTAATTAALEAAAGAVSRGFSAATVEDVEDPVADALTPSTMGLIGRDLIRRGESLFLIEVDRGGLALRPAGSWDVRGGHREADWMYRLDLFGPSGNITRFVPAASVLHVRYAVDPARPWHGVGPLGWAALSGALHAGVARALNNDMAAASGTVIPMPPSEGSDNPDDDPLTKLKRAIVAARGKSVFVETTAGSFGGDTRDAPRQDWVQKRLGSDPPATLAGLHDTTAQAVLAACGVDPLVCGFARGDGTAMRESYRRLERLVLGPLGRIVETELASKLGAPDLSLNFDSLRASDFAGVARAYKALTEAGLSPDAAAGQLDMEL